MSKQLTKTEIEAIINAKNKAVVEANKALPLRQVPTSLLGGNQNGDNSSSSTNEKPKTEKKD